MVSLHIFKCEFGRGWDSVSSHHVLCCLQLAMATESAPVTTCACAAATLTGPDHIIVENNYVYPYGTTEQFPSDGGHRLKQVGQLRSLLH
jgi:hypothetical protein